MILTLLGLAILGWFSSVRIVREYERLHVFRMGKLVDVKAPGFQVFLPIYHQTVLTDLRLRSLVMSGRRVMSKDNLSLELSVVFFYKINNPTACWGDPGGWIASIVQTALFASAGERDFQTILAEPEQFNRRLMEIVSSRLGADAAVAISEISLLSVKIEPDMVNAMAKVAIAERERRAKIISANADFESAPRLVEAARIMSEQPGTMGLRQLSTMLQIGRDQNSTLIFPFAYEMLNGSTADERSDEKEQLNS